MRHAWFISFEGIDGAGKSTHIEGLSQWFKSRGHVVTLTREPGGTPLAEKFRELALHETMDPLTEALLMFAARREHLIHVIEPALARGEVVLCDRFTDATFAYQGGGRDFDWNILKVLEKMVQQVPASSLRQPDLTIWFDLSPSVAAKRLSTARVPDKFESQPQSFFQAVREGYAKRMQEAPSRFAQISADQSREAVWADVLKVVEMAYTQ
jgi:dTMP kinase